MSKNTSLLKEGEDPLGLEEEVEERRGRREEREGERRRRKEGVCSCKLVQLKMLHRNLFAVVHHHSEILLSSPPVLVCMWDYPQRSAGSSWQW